MAAAAPVEFRYFLRKFTLDHAVSGLTPVRHQTMQGVELFAPPMLQSRYQVKVGEGRSWSDWEDVRYVREGIEDAEH